MEELALYCCCSEDAVELIVVCGQRVNRAGLPRITAYVGGSLGGGRWRAERILVERTPDESVALVSEMGEWSAGRTFVRGESPEYRPASRRTAGPVDSDLDDMIYDLVKHWVYWDEGVLRLRSESVGSRFSNGVARVGPVDASTIDELHSIWLVSAPESS